MATKLIQKKSSVAGKVPLTGDLDYGELALNYQDGKLYYKDASNNIKYFPDSAEVVNLVGDMNHDTITFTKQTTVPAYTDGMLFYDSDNDALTFYNSESEFALNIGQETVVRVYNNSGSTISTGAAVYFTGAVNDTPTVDLAQADSDTTSEFIGLASHDIENTTYGYVTMVGLVKDVDTSSFSQGDTLYLSPTTPGGFTATQPVSPYYVVHVGQVLKVDAVEGIIFATNHEELPDSRELYQSMDGMAFDKGDFYVTESGGQLFFEIEAIDSAGDMDFLINGVRSTLDCTTGSGSGGRAQVGLTEGTDANNPVTNYLYVTDSGGTAILNASTTLPTGAFGWIGKVIVPDATTWATTGEYLFQRYTETFNNDGRGLHSHTREKLRALGALYISGDAPSLAITVNGATPDNVHLETATTTVYQLHRQTFPAFTTGPYYYGNGTSNQYDTFSDLNEVLQLEDGTAITNNQRYNIVVWGAVNYSTGDCKLYVNQPLGIYGADDAASADIYNYADYTVPDDFRSVAFLIARVALKYTTLNGGTFEELGTYSLLGTPVGVRAGGAQTVPSTVSTFSDAAFKVYDDVDDTKELAFQLSGVTTATTRTLTIPDKSGTIATDEITLTAGTGLIGGGDLSANRTFSIDSAEFLAAFNASIVHDNLSGYVANEHIDWTIDQSPTTIHPNNVPGNSYTAGAGLDLTDQVFSIDSAGFLLYYEGIITHDNLTGVDANQHVDHSTVSITAGTGLTGGGDLTTTRDIAIDSAEFLAAFNASIVHDNLAGFDSNEHIDWTIDQGALNIHANNVPGATVYTAGAGISLVNDEFSIDSAGFLLYYEGIITHDNLTGVDANDHVDHSGVSITAGFGLKGGGDITTTRDLAIDSAEFISYYEGIITHDNLTGVDANDHVDHTTVSITAGTGLTGGGDISATRDIAIDSAEFLSYFSIAENRTPSSSTDTGRLGQIAWDSDYVYVAIADNSWKRGKISHWDSGDSVVQINAQTGTTYTTVLSDAGKLITMSNDSDNTITIPPNSSVAYPLRTYMEVIQLGAGVTTIASGAGVTINGVASSSYSINNRYRGGAYLVKLDTDTWIATGDIDSAV